MTIREGIGTILHLAIPKDGWDYAFQSSSRAGGISQRQIVDMLIVICKKVEELEDGEQKTITQSAKN